MQHFWNIAAVVLSVTLGLNGCGGGGGGDGDGGAAAAPSAAPPSASAGPPGSGSPSASPGPSTGQPAPGAGPAAAPFVAFGPVTVAQGVSTEPEGGAPPVITRLAGGGSVVAWNSGGTVFAQVLDASGNRVGAPASVPSTTQAFTVAGLGNGGWVLAWSAQGARAEGQLDAPVTVQFRRYAADGTLVQDTTPGHPLSFIAVPRGLQAIGTSDGGFALAFAARPAIGVPNLVYLRRFGPGGDSRGGPDGVGTAAAEQTRPRLAALPDGSTVLAWLQAGPAAGTTSIQTQRFGTAGETIGPARQLAGSSGTGSLELAAAGLPGGDVALAWTGHVTAEQPSTATVHWQVLDAAGEPRTERRSSTVGPQVNGVAVAPRPSGFTLLAHTVDGFPRGAVQRLQAAPVEANGEIGGFTLLREASLSTVSPTTGATTGPAAAGFSVAGGADGRHVFAYGSGTPGAMEILAEGR